MVHAWFSMRITHFGRQFLILLSSLNRKRETIHLWYHGCCSCLAIPHFILYLVCMYPFTFVSCLVFVFMSRSFDQPSANALVGHSCACIILCISLSFYSFVLLLPSCIFSSSLIFWGRFVFLTRLDINQNMSLHFSIVIGCQR